ncbi:MAG: hypothetical protein Q8M95_04150 [Candidatus Methanoperedens sp.]|nr:hypothetical protein [Candidatus Methanoperedens sp.]
MPDEKFVAYIDILGFAIMSTKRGKGAEIKLTKFNQSIVDVWKELNLHPEFNNEEDIYEINGFTFSDSLIIYTRNDSIEGLKKILEFVRKLYKISLFEHNIMLRGGLAKGKFDIKRPIGLDNLEKNLFYGKAFIDAYNLENRKGIKGCRFVFNTAIKDILNRHGIQNLYPSLKLENQKSKIRDYAWINLNELCENNNKRLNLFYELAKENKWEEQYSRTLDLFCSIAGINKYDIIKQGISKSSVIPG